MSNEELIDLINAGYTALTATLCEQNRGFIYRIARKLRKLDDPDDLAQWGYIGLLQAIPEYKPDKGANFLTHAYYYILGAMLRGTPGAFYVPEHMREKVREYRQFIEQYQKETGQDPPPLLLKRRYGNELETIQTAADVVFLSLDAQITEDGGRLEDIIPAPATVEDDVIEAAYKEELAAAIWGAVDELPEKQAETIRSRYKEGRTLAETGKITGVSTERARQNEAKALRTLRKSKQIRPYYDEIRSAALQGGGLEAFRRSWTSSTERIAMQLYGE